jgi:hypothetical protein
MTSIGNRFGQPGVSLSFAIGIAAGAFVWAASPALTGHQEPWDADSGFYFAYLLCVGLVAGLLVPRTFWACPLGIYLGQAAAMLLLLEFGSLAPLGLVIVLPIMSVLNLIGWCAGALLHHSFRRAFAILARSAST